MRMVQVHFAFHGEKPATALRQALATHRKNLEGIRQDTDGRAVAYAYDPRHKSQIGHDAFTHEQQVYAWVQEFPEGVLTLSKVDVVVPLGFSLPRKAKDLPPSTYCVRLGLILNCYTDIAGFTHVGPVDAQGRSKRPFAGMLSQYEYLPAEQAEMLKRAGWPGKSEESLDKNKEKTILFMENVIRLMEKMQAGKVFQNGMFL